MTRLCVARLEPGELIVSGGDRRYLVLVRRLRAGDRVVLFDGRGREADAVIARVDAEGVALSVGEPRAASTTTAPLTLLVALLKGEKMDLVVQKSTELGVTRIVPVATERSVVRLDAERASSRAARWRKIAVEASRQSRRADAPEIDPPAPFSDALRALPPGGARVLLHEGERDGGARDALSGVAPGEAIVVAVGPEGGFTPVELDQARAAGFRTVGFGPRILRAETAAVAVISVCAFVRGDLG